MIKGRFEKRLLQLSNNVGTVTLAYCGAVKPLYTAIPTGDEATIINAGENALHKIKMALSNATTEQLEASYYLIKEMAQLQKRANNPEGLFETVATRVGTWKVGQWLSYSGAIIALIAAILEVIGGQRLELVAKWLCAEAAAFGLGILLQINPYSQQNLERTTKFIKKIHLSVARLSSVLAQLDLHWRGNLRLQFNPEDGIEILKHLECQIDWHLEIPRLFLEFNIGEYSGSLPLSTELEEEREHFSRSMAQQPQNIDLRPASEVIS